MTLATTVIARSFGMTEDELMEQAVRRFIYEKRREILQEKLTILARYEVDSIEELQERISKGEISEHPAWEDLIAAENLSASLEELDAHLRTI